MRLWSAFLSGTVVLMSPEERERTRSCPGDALVSLLLYITCSSGCRRHTHAPELGLQALVLARASLWRSVPYSNTGGNLSWPACPIPLHTVSLLLQRGPFFLECSSHLLFWFSNDHSDLRSQVPWYRDVPWTTLPHPAPPDCPSLSSPGTAMGGVGLCRCSFLTSRASVHPDNSA